MTTKINKAESLLLNLLKMCAKEVHIVSQFIAAPRTSHHSAAIHIPRYVKGTLLHGLHFYSHSSLTLSGYSYGDWASDPTGRHSATSFYFFLGDSLISWRSKKQTLVSRSSVESKYRTLTDSTTELIWLRRLLIDIGVPQSSSMDLHCNSKSAMKMTHNDTFHERTKHIELDFHFIRQHVVGGAVNLVSVPP
ncbi:secreted RxLR effector protein 161-like [Andrographis paniculata]|uniref:secreted RxLR effector protein 161-like n=1 Tax=Andrographis paniculata TaxID=175694 RepID=UPI0021E76303|nr:secreted RxLR effector protein 161-like [Andrographis paniculata]